MLVPTADLLGRPSLDSRDEQLLGEKVGLPLVYPAHKRRTGCMQSSWLCGRGSRPSSLQLALGFTCLFLLTLGLRSYASVDSSFLKGLRRAPASSWQAIPRDSPFAKPENLHEYEIRRPFVKNPVSKRSYRPNLLPGERYITAQSYLGFNNQFQSIIHLLYLALKTERVAILPPLQPIHIKPASFARWSDFFDLDGLQKATGVAVIEWQDIKDSILDGQGSLPEEIACWSSREASSHKRGRYQLGEDMTFDFLGLKRVMWPLPGHIRGTGAGYAPLNALIAFDGDAAWKEEWIAEVEAGNSTRLDRISPPRGSLRPDEQILCFDDMFYLQSTTHEPSPSYPHAMVGPQQIYGSMGIADHDMAGWSTIGKHMRWTKAVREETDRFLRYTLGLSEGARVPAYISAHIRHGDFSAHQTVEAFAEKVNWVRAQLDERGPFKGTASRLPVICSTDESHPDFLAQIKARGWYLIDHQGFGTVERHGLVSEAQIKGWWPTIISSAILGGSQGIVGTHWSTFSIYSWIRVLTWQEGVGTEA